MYRNGGVIVIALVSATLAVAWPAHRAQVGAQVYEALRAQERVRVVVALREPSGDPRDLTSRMAAVNATQRNVLAELRPGEFRLTHQWDTISGFAGEVTPAGLLKLREDPDVLQIDVDPPAYAHLGVSVPLIHASEVQSQGFTGKGVTVAILDTGVDTHHPDLADNIVDQACFCTSPSGAGCCPNGATQQSGAGAAEDDQGHGTNVAGIITGGGRVAPRGVAPDASIVAIKILDKTGAGTSTSMLSGLDYVLKSRPEVKVVNFSLGLSNLFEGTCDSAAAFTTGFAQTISALKARGTAVFASTGNQANPSQIAVPACISTAIAVGAVYERDAGTVSFGCTDPTTSTDKVACFSNSSSKLDLLAPGAPITSSGMGGGTVTFLGTSQACPHAAAAAALLLQANPALTPDRLLVALKTTSVTVTDSRNGRASPRLDVKAALDAAR